MGVFKSIKSNFSSLVNKIFKKGGVRRIGIYGPPNAGKTTLANRIVRDWSGDVMGSVSHVEHETRRARRREGVVITANNGSS
ncbi:MAG: 50S ribosome-binding GTPase, partial [Methanosarcinales archaeon]|nr:50S ribosome-binding GTPase [Methanosarcinales archaeon]